MHAFPLIVFAVILAGLAGCTGNRAEVSLPTGIAETPQLPVAIYTGEGSEASYFDVLDAALLADVVFIGETHGHAVGLDFAAHLFEDILNSRPEAALSMEFYERDRQVALDDYLAGVTDIEAFEEASGRTPGNNPPGHWRMVEAARAAGAPVIAANAPRRYVTLSRMEGYERLRELSAEQRRLFDIPERMPSGGYRERFDELMGPMMGSGAHGEPVAPEEIPARLEAGFRSQSLWDATMAASVDRALVSSGPVVHVIGRFHTDFEGGTHQLLRDRRPQAEIVTISVLDREPGPIDPEDVGRADFVVYAGSLPEEDADEPAEVAGDDADG